MELNLPVVFDVGGVVNEACAAQGLPPVPFGGIYSAADHCLSTSVLEGFGYALYEPWLYGLPLIGRRPSEFEPFAGLPSRHLYESLLVPLAWVGMSRFSRRVQRMAQALGADQCALRSILDGVIRSGLVDFSMLGRAKQLAIVRNVACRPSLAEAILCYRGGGYESAASALCGPAAREAGERAAEYGERVRSHLGVDAFAAAFRDVFQGQGLRRFQPACREFRQVSLEGALRLMP